MERKLKIQFVLIAVCIISFHLGAYASGGPNIDNEIGEVERLMNLAKGDFLNISAILSEVAREEIEIDKEIRAAERAKKNSTVKTNTTSTTFLVTKVEKRNAEYGEGEVPVAGLQKLDSDLSATSDKVRKTKEELEKATQGIPGIKLDFRTPTDLITAEAKDLSAAESKLKDLKKPEASVLTEVEASFKKAEGSIRKTVDYMQSIFKCLQLYLGCSKLNSSLTKECTEKLSKDISCLSTKAKA